MTQSFMLTQKTISTLQAQVELFEQCLHFPNAQHEVNAQLAEMANTKGISQDELRQEITQFKQKLERLAKAFNQISEKPEEELIVLYFVKFVFLLNELLETYWDFFLRKDAREAIKQVILKLVALYKEAKNAVSPITPKKDADYVVIETLKHSLNSLIKVGLQVSAFSPEEINAFDLGDITPQESETMLIFLSTMKKWEPVYKRLAAS
ncbi:MAG: hypothetical protein V7L31_24085 [Nostoc sp.]|uniref:hypothetical protein n=1 Tax=Nostoc sp. TaxID=1180 RepID=UPI002FEFD25F